MRKKPIVDHDLSSKRFLVKSIPMVSCLFLMLLAATVLTQCALQAVSEDQIGNWVITEDEIQGVFGVGIEFADSHNYRGPWLAGIINGWDVQVERATLRWAGK